MRDILAIDRWAGTGRGWLHRTPPALKLAALALVVATLVAVQSSAPLAVLYCVLLVALLTSGLPVFALLLFSAIPVVLSGVFALTRLGAGWDQQATILLKGAITSLSMLLLVSSTPHTVLLRLARRCLPLVLADLLFLGYRALFVVLGRALAAREAVRLRGAAVPLPRRLQRNGVVAALAVLRATELASDQYAALRLRSVAPPGWRAPRGTAGSAPFRQVQPRELPGTLPPARVPVGYAFRRGSAPPAA